MNDAMTWQQVIFGLGFMAFAALALWIVTRD